LFVALWLLHEDLVVWVLVAVQVGVVDIGLLEVPHQVVACNGKQKADCCELDHGRKGYGVVNARLLAKALSHKLDLEAQHFAIGA
jgi:hypothetical protein